MVFVFDVDDTISETDKYSEYYLDKFFEQNHLLYQKISPIARYAEQKYAWSHMTALDWYKKYGDQMMLEFPVKKNVKNLFDFLHQNGHKIVIATARSTEWHQKPKEVTECWLKLNGLYYDKLYVDCDKIEVCEAENADVFVDDDIGLCVDVKRYFANKKDVKVLVATTEYNKWIKIPNYVTRINDFKEIKDKLSHPNVQNSKEL